jgi:hypothetical protein
VEQLPPPHELHEELERELELALGFSEEPTPNSEKSRSDLRLPHLGHALPVSFPIAQSFSNFLPHERHLNSYIGMEKHPHKN